MKYRFYILLVTAGLLSGCGAGKEEQKTTTTPRWKNTYTITWVNADTVAWTHLGNFRVKADTLFEPNFSNDTVVCIEGVNYILRKANR